ncbi:hypothetical protein pEaSNUABM34_00020 [Erwinia phage pEa_SNUABM_34]|nr:hypothetical protein pEaSNUABM34_00020 [Erwinia phage pEa_SNUABM_34]
MAKHQLRKLFEQHVKKEVKADKVAVLLSSGLDGLVSALAAHDLGKKVHAFTFQMGDNPSFDSRHAQIVAQKMGWEFTLVKVPTSVSAIALAWRVLHSKYRCIKKRDYECAYPMVYCYKAIKDAGYKYVLSGLVADGYFLYNRNTHIQKISGPHSDAQKYHEFRTQYFSPWLKHGKKSLGVDGYNPSGMLQHEMLCDNFGLIHVNPWMQNKVFDYFIKYTWQELNQPKQKMPLTEAWAEHIALVGHRPHRGYQTEAKVPEYFEHLIDNPEINFNGRKRIMDVARDWSKREPE